MIRTIVLALSLCSILAVGRGLTDTPAAAAPLDAPVTAAPTDAPIAAFETQPQLICLDRHFTNTRTLKCPGSTKKVVCSTSCTTHRSVDTSTDPDTCVDGLTICMQEVCDYSNC